MKRMSSGRATCALLVLSCLVFLTGCENGNLFGGLHKRGDSGNVEYLLSDANVALQGKDYAGALALYEQILQQDPNNAEALYGASVAALGNSGLNFGTLISNVVAQNSSVSAGLSEAITSSREVIRGSAAGADSILAGIDVAALNQSIDKAICRLSRIVQGSADGSIANDDVDVLVNLAFLHAVRAVSKPIEYSLLDITNTAGTYAVDAQSITTGQCAGTSLFGPFTGDSTPSSNQQAFFRRVIQDVASSYTLLNRVVLKLNLANDQIISRVQSDVADAVDSLFVELDNGTYPDCRTRFNEVGFDGVGTAADLASFDYNANNSLSACQ